MFRLVSLALGSFALCVAVSADTTRMQIEFAGNPAGENVYTLNPDGTFVSTTHLTLGTTHLDSTISGKFVGDRIVSFTTDQKGGGVQHAVITFDRGKIHVNADKTVVDRRLDVGKRPYFGNLHPQFTASVLATVDLTKKTDEKIDCFCPDSVAMLSPRFRAEGSRAISAGSAKMFDMTLGAVEGTYALDSSNHVVMFDVPGQKLRFIVAGWEGLSVDPLAAYPELSQPTFKVTVDKGVRMKTRDGVTLVADVIRPDAPGKYPAILERTPYGRSSSALEGPFYAKRGYVYVAQDCRGRSDSGGEWDPFMHERKDGYDAVQWVASQPWSDGNVGMIGASYGGFVQWAAAVERPPALKCIVPQVSPPDAFLNLPYDNGVFFLYGAVWWSKIVADKTADMSSVLSKLPHPDKFGTLPLGKVDQAVLGRHIPFYAKWLARTTATDWAGWNYEDDLGKVTIPALNISGWFDGDEIGTMTNWAAMRKLGRTNQWLVYGPWTHFFNTMTKIGDTDFGSSSVIDLDSVYLRWFDTWLKHKEVSFEKRSHVQAFVMGSNEWVESSDWPLSQSKPTKLYFSATGDVQGSATTGRLTSVPAAGQAPSRYKFDPHDAPVSDKFLNPDPDKGSLVFTLPAKSPGTAVFETEALAKPLTMSGPIELDLRFSTSAHNTDFFVNIVDIDGKGKYHGTGQPGKIRCSYLNGFKKQVALQPGKIYQAHIRLWDRAHQFAKGHRVGVVLSSTAFPLFARNLGTIEPIATSSRIEVQNQKIYHDQKNPSSLSFYRIGD